MGARRIESHSFGLNSSVLNFLRPRFPQLLQFLSLEVVKFAHERDLLIEFVEVKGNGSVMTLDVSSAYQRIALTRPPDYGYFGVRLLKSRTNRPGTETRGRR